MRPLMYLHRSINVWFMNERFKATTDVWNWLPAFRAVAETEHLPTAGEMMNVTPPALSRAVRQLEEAVGRELFVRSGRTMQLNEDGRRLAIAVRMAMRTVHTALEELASARRAHRGHHLAALARVAASSEGFPAPGVAAARELLSIQ